VAPLKITEVNEWQEMKKANLSYLFVMCGKHRGTGERLGPFEKSESRFLGMPKLDLIGFTSIKISMREFGREEFKSHLAASVFTFAAYPRILLKRPGLT